MKPHPSRKDLLNHINEISFVVNDIQLYLDTHPDDEEALACFHKYKSQRVKALEEYSACYGPLTIDTVDEACTDRWNWINEPWPWQEGGC